MGKFWRKPKKKENGGCRWRADGADEESRQRLNQLQLPRSYGYDIRLEGVCITFADDALLFGLNMMVAFA